MIELDGVSKSFDGGRTFAVAETSLAIPRGSFVAVVGASGSGKTTLVKMINRLVEPDALRRRIGYVFQGVGLFPHLTIAENVAITPRLLGWTPERVQARTTDMLALVGLRPDFAARSPAQLSGGQRQRVGIARALAAEPEILLLDEPFGALDAIVRDELGREVRALHERLGLTTVLITHDVLEAVLLADRVVVMREGRVLADGPPATLLGDQPDAYVRELMSTPRRQAERVSLMLEGAS